MRARHPRHAAHAAAVGLWVLGTATFLAGGPVVTGCGDEGCGECVQAVECVRTCGGEIVQSGCCPCPEDTFDVAECAGDCEDPRRCVERCGDAPLDTTCDACPEGTFDDVTCVPAGCRDPSCCPAPYRELVDDGCVWSCGPGTEPDEASGECQCSEGLVETGVDALGRRVCSASVEA